MKKLIVLAAILTIATASLSGCSQAQPVEDADQPSTPVVEEPITEPADDTVDVTPPELTPISDEITPAATDKSFDDLVMNPYSISDVSINGDIMTVKVGYTGCNKDEFHAYWPAIFMESYPVQASVLLTRGTEVYDITCEMFIEDTVEINLTTVKREYENSYQTDTGTILLSVTDGKDAKETVTYEF
jgi:hypothetical protein